VAFFAGAAFFAAAVVFFAAVFAGAAFVPLDALDRPSGAARARRGAAVVCFSTAGSSAAVRGSAEPFGALAMTPARVPDADVRQGRFDPHGSYSHTVNVERVRDAYTSVADLYIGLFGTSQQVHTDDLALIERHLSIQPGNVLDLGCGPGHITGYLRSLGVDAVGIDMVPEFIAHARANHPTGEYRLGSMRSLDVENHSIAGILAWYSLIHLPPPDLDEVLAEFRRMMTPAGTLVVGFFDGDEVEAFDHKVVTAYRWPADEFSARLARAGFTEVERQHRAGDGTHRPLAAIAAVVAR
jgi:SAM-dependent methyltransferase